MVWLFLAVATAQEIQSVAPGQCVRPTVQSYLLPGTHYDNCLKAAMNLPVCQEALDACTEKSLAAIDSVVAALGVSVEQLESEDELGQFLAQTIEDLESQRDKASKKEDRLRNQRNVLLAVGGTLLITTAVGIAL